MRFFLFFVFLCLIQSTSAVYPVLRPCFSGSGLNPTTSYATMEDVNHKPDTRMTITICPAQGQPKTILKHVKFIIVEQRDHNGVVSYHKPFVVCPKGQDCTFVRTNGCIEKTVSLGLRLNQQNHFTEVSFLGEMEHKLYSLCHQ